MLGVVPRSILKRRGVVAETSVNSYSTLIPFAHVADDGRRQPLIEHLTATAQRAASFAGEFDCAECGYLVGLWHDLGKFSPEFQSYILAARDADAHMEGSKPGRVDHSAAGAIHAVDKFGVRGRILAYPIAGHHAGLADWESDQIAGAALSQRPNHPELLDAARQGGVPSDIMNRPLPGERPRPSADPALWVRLLFSCAVDADFLDTEAFLELDKADLRGHRHPPPSDLLTLFSNYMYEKQAKATDTSVNGIRREVLEQRIAASQKQPGTYTLTVPTGGGKTLSAMVFSLHHAVKYAKRRVIYVIPYTSIIEQTADQFRSIFGDAVVEHRAPVFSGKTKADCFSADGALRTFRACLYVVAPIITGTPLLQYEDK